MGGSEAQCAKLRFDEGVTYCKTWRTLDRAATSRSALDCGSPLPLSSEVRKSKSQHRPFQTFYASRSASWKSFTPHRSLTRSQSARGLAHSKTWRTLDRAATSRSALDCGSPLPLSSEVRKSKSQHRLFQTFNASRSASWTALVPPPRRRDGGCRFPPKSPSQVRNTLLKLKSNPGLDLIH
jgi:hypothetical protein